MHSKQEAQIQSLGQEDPLEKGIVTHSSILPWRIPCTGGLQPMGSQKVRHNLVTFTFLTTKSLCNPMYSRPPGSSVHGRLQAEYWSGKPFPPPGDLPNPWIEPGSPASQADSSPSSHQRSPETGGCPPEPLLPSVHHGRTGVRHVLYFSASLVIRPWGLRPHPQPCCVQVWP